MLAAGVHLKVVSERLGHSTIGITADLYTHVADEVHEAAAASFDAFLGPSVRK
jgi:integrase